MGDKGGNNIKVVCRIRPQNRRELAEGGTVIVEPDENDVSIHIDNGKDIKFDFTFDRVFGMGTSQAQIFDYSIKSTVEDVLAGYNGTVFAYGQTGSGKTFTMMGADIDNEELRGVIPRIANTIFTSIMASPPNMEYTVKVSYMEIYMEKIRDLLNPSNDNLPVHEEKNRGVYVKGLLEVYVSTIEEIYEVLRRGSQARIVSSTNMNAESSRSHSIFVVTITQKNLNDGSLKTGRLYLVDLAGSEKVGKTGASGQTLEEAKKINKSLTSLGMVINALTDGKSKHVPYRDSKLTRILQESLGGNSRTTLIINCSPSSFNDAETLGTLRFGMRAKSIKNQAKANVDLSPAELKALLKKAKSEAVSFKSYISALEGEVGVWRTGGTVPEEKYATFAKVAPNGATPPAPPPPAAAPQGPPRSPPLGDPSRSDTPAPGLAEDEREDFLKRENELMDQITEKETELSNQTKLAEQLKEELTMWKEEGTQLREENKHMTTELGELRVQMEKTSYESKETIINLDSVKEANQELTRELDELRDKLNELRQSQKDNVEEERNKKKNEKMAMMMQGLDPAGAFDAKEKELRKTLITLESMDGEESLTNAEAEQLRQGYAAAKSTLEQQEQMIEELSRENIMITRKRDELEIRLSTLESEFEELLDKTIAEEEANVDDLDVSETLHDLKSKMEAQYTARRLQQQKEIEELQTELERKTDETHKTNTALTELKRANEELLAKVAKLEAVAANRAYGAGSQNAGEKEVEMDRIRRTMAQQLADFEAMKKSLMRDLQQRCEKVVELEISLEETREQYNQVLRNSNNKQQQKKMTFLERNLEQLTQVQKQLVEQNSQLKKEFAVAERKLIARNERIQSLEHLLQDAQNKLSTQNQKFEAQLQAVRERLEQARSAKAAQNGAQGFNFGRIAKPLRGGGNPAITDGSISTITAVGPVAQLVKEEKTSAANKRSSWLGWRG